MSNTEHITGVPIGNGCGGGLLDDGADTLLYEEHPDALQKGDVDKSGNAFSETDLKRREEIAQKNTDYRNLAQKYYEEGNEYKHNDGGDGKVIGSDSLMEGVDPVKLAAKKAKAESATDMWAKLVEDDRKSNNSSSEKKPVTVDTVTITVPASAPTPARANMWKMDQMDLELAEKRKGVALERITYAKIVLLNTLDALATDTAYGTTHINKNPNQWMIDEATKQLKVSFVLLEKALEKSSE